ALDSPDTEARIWAVRCLSSISPRSGAVVAPLLKATSDRCPELRMAAISSLNGLPEEKVLPTLLRLLKSDADIRVRQVAMASISSYGAKAKDAIAPVVDLLKQDLPFFRRIPLGTNQGATPAWVLSEIGPLAAPSLFEIVGDARCSLEAR